MQSSEPNEVTAFVRQAKIGALRGEKRGEVVRGSPKNRTNHLRIAPVGFNVRKGHCIIEAGDQPTTYTDAKKPAAIARPVEIACLDSGDVQPRGSIGFDGEGAGDAIAIGFGERIQRHGFDMPIAP